MPDVLITGLITFTASVVTGLIALFATRRKDNADTASKIASAYDLLAEDLRKQIHDMQSELAELRPLRDRVHELEYQQRCSQQEISTLQGQMLEAKARIVSLEHENSVLKALKAGA
jgi:predicted  nucleic acid-binding Zn-ribbon protein